MSPRPHTDRADAAHADAGHADAARPDMRQSERLCRVAANERGRDFMVGDIHGYFHVLERLLAKIGFDESGDRLFSVGDLIDRGPESHRALEFLDRPWFNAIRGNHEQMLLDALQPGPHQAAAADLWKHNGGRWIEAVDPTTQRALVARLDTLPWAFEIDMADGGRAGLIHADVHRSDWPATGQLLADPNSAPPTLQPLLWGRDRAWALQDRLGGVRHPGVAAVDGIDLVAFGHTPMPLPIACANTRWLDTHVFDGGRLTVAEVTMAGQVWSLDVRRGKLHSGWHAVAH